MKMTNFINQRKPVKSSLSAFYRISILSLVFTLISTLTYADTVGFFSKVEGRVDILKEGDTRAVPVKANDNVSMGDIVRTKSDGKTEITFKDDTTVRIAPKTRLKIDEYTFNPDNSRNKGALGLFRGKVRAVVSKTKGIIPVAIGASTFNVNTPTAIAGVKGTDFFVFYDKGITGVIFREGQGFVANPNMPEQVVNVNAGQITFIKIDAPPLPPRPASNIEMAQHTKDTAPAEKPKEKKEEGQKPKEEKTQMKEAKAETKKEDKKEDKKEAKGEEKVAEKKEEKGAEEKKTEEDKAEVKEAKTEAGEVKEEKSVEDKSAKVEAKGEGERPAGEEAPPSVEGGGGEAASAGNTSVIDKSSSVETSGVDLTVGAVELGTPAAGGEAFGYTPPADIAAVTEIIAATNTTTDTITDTATLLPVTETVPETLKPASVHMDITFGRR
ncbi:MAG TPA: hypothetical protein DCY98_00215 [Nitrospinae bacterium]|nr:hypothetical protein [Nitrospinota bacterium]